MMDVSTSDAPSSIPSLSKPGLALTAPLISLVTPAMNEE